MKGMLLRVQFSPGLGRRIGYERDLPGELFRRHPAELKTKYGEPKPATDPRSTEEILASLPLGSRVTWTNLVAKESSYFRNENTIKLGQDLFAAHGFGVGKDNRFTRKKLEENLAMQTTLGATPSPDYLSKNIFISSMEVFETPSTQGWTPLPLVPPAPAR